MVVHITLNCSLRYRCEDSARIHTRYTQPAVRKPLISLFSGIQSFLLLSLSAHQSSSSSHVFCFLFFHFSRLLAARTRECKIQLMLVCSPIVAVDTKLLISSTAARGRTSAAAVVEMPPTITDDFSTVAGTLGKDLVMFNVSKRQCDRWRHVPAARGWTSSG